METRSREFQNPKPGSKAAPPPQTRPSTPLSLSARLYGPVLAVKGSASPCSAPLTAPGRALGFAVYEGKGGTATGGKSTRTRLHKGAVLQPLGPGRVFKGLGVAKRYCSIDSIGDRFSRRRRGKSPGAPMTGYDSRLSAVPPRSCELRQRLEESVKDLKPQLGRTGALAEDLKQQVESLRADYREIAKVLRGV